MNSLKKKYIIASALQLVCIIFWFIPLCTVVTSYRKDMMGGVSGISTEMRSLVEFFKGAEALAVVSIVGLVLSLVLLVFPIIKSTESKKRRLIYPKISAIYPIIMLLFSYLFPYFQATQYADVASGFKFGFGGILFIVFNIALLIILIKISSESKKIKKSFEETANNTINE